MHWHANASLCNESKLGSSCCNAACTACAADALLAHAVIVLLLLGIQCIRIVLLVSHFYVFTAATLLLTSICTALELRKVRLAVKRTLAALFTI